MAEGRFAPTPLTEHVSNLTFQAIFRLGTLHHSLKIRMTHSIQKPWSIARVLLSPMGWQNPASRMSLLDSAESKPLNIIHIHFDET